MDYVDRRGCEMKTPEEIIDEVKVRWASGHAAYNGATVLSALDAAGYVIVPKEIQAPCPQIYAMFDAVEQETNGKSLEVYMSVRLATAMYHAAVAAT